MIMLRGEVKERRINRWIEEIKRKGWRMIEEESE